MLVLYKNVRNVRFVLFTKTSIVKTRGGLDLWGFRVLVYFSDLHYYIRLYIYIVFYIKLFIMSTSLIYFIISGDTIFGWIAIQIIQKLI